MYYGKEKGIIIPIKQQTIRKAKDHPFFGSLKGGKGTQAVDERLDKLRGERCRAF